MSNQEEVKVEIVEEEKEKKSSNFWWWVLGGASALWIFSKGYQSGVKQTQKEVEGGLKILFKSDPELKEHMVNACTDEYKRRLMSK